MGVQREARRGSAVSAIAIIAIDPGGVESAWVGVDPVKLRPIGFGKQPNSEIITQLGWNPGSEIVVAIEQIGHYGTGMPAGRDVFDTCRAIGRMEQVCEQRGLTPMLIKRATVKAHLCGTPKAKDANVTQALVDRFAPGASNHGKGTKTDPGWFHGFHRDIWQAYALAVYVADNFAELATP